MTNQHKPVTSCLLRCASAFAFAAALAIVPVSAQAVDCELGRIIALEVPAWGNSGIRVATDRSPALDSQRDWMPIIGRGTLIRLGDETRWRDKVSLLRTAFALQQPIYIYSNDRDCIGGQDEFSISLCTDGRPGC
jgi:hypothetical protein